MRKLVLEIGTEEIPARFMSSSLKQLKELALEKMKENRLEFTELKVFGTPRRLVLIIDNLVEKQKDLVMEIRGPSVKAAFDQEGNMTKAALGFARGQGVKPTELMVRETDNGAYVFAVKKDGGVETQLILAKILPEIILGLHFPKPMRWGNTEMRYVRPIRWIIALFGAETIEFQIENIWAANISRGHRFLGSQTIEIADAEVYCQVMEENFVELNPQIRKEMILSQIKDLTADFDGIAQIDENLLEEVVHLVEFPTALMGGFDEKYLAMPQEAIITPMKEHQRYFPVTSEEGQLLPKFITVRNGDEQHLEVVQAGNEKVLEARLSDAKFFYDEDQKIPLESYLPRLESIIFQETLGTISEKVSRIVQGVRILADILGVKEEITKKACRAAYLSKADLVTNMVYEFPELQGVMGEKYALLSGEDKIVARAIFEHYLPRNADDILPNTLEGALVSIADKMDTITGCFAVGIEPTGSQDPYGLRRQALGICKIIINQELDLSLKTVINQGLSLFTGKLDLNLEVLTNKVHSFFEQRVRNILGELGYRYDVIEAIINSGYDNVYDTWQRAKALDQIRKTTDFAKLLSSFTRANNLAKKAGKLVVNEEYMLEEVEKKLFESLQAAQTEIDRNLQDKNFLKGLEILAQLEGIISEFFEDVLVMAEDEKVRNNRLALLQLVTQLVWPIADLTQIVED